MGFPGEGLCAAAFGVLTWVWPGITVRVVLVAFGAFALANGILSISEAVDSWDEKDGRWLFVLEGLLGIGIAIITLFAPRVTAVALLFYIAIWTLPMGVLEIVIAVLLLLFPGRGILSLIWVLSIYAEVFGILLVILAFRLLAQVRRMKAPPPA